MDLKLYNTLSRNVEKFIPIEEKKVKMYTCGPTVYNYAHIGNLRTYIFEDVLKRTLKYNGYEVNHAMNITDVGHLQSDGDTGEDKMEMGAKRENKSVLDIARFYEGEFLKDLQFLNIQVANHIPRATDHVKEMIELIEKLEKRGYTYIANNNVYFSIDKFEDYNKLANLSLEEMNAGNRVEVDIYKKNPLDFVLWFTNSKYENHILQWDSPWGVGFPGWHVECSAMAIKYLGEYMDIHCGGIDHIPVHHTNEIAQSEGTLGHKWVNYWLHGEFLILDKGKMSKSSGSFITLNNLIENNVDPLVYRYYVLQSKYRKPLVFSYDRLKDASNSFEILKNKVRLINENINDEMLTNANIIEEYKNRFLKYINDDLNIANGFTLLHEVIKSEKLNNKDKKMIIDDFDKVFGLKLNEISDDKEKLNKDFVNKINLLIAEREAARKNKDYKKSDEIRDYLFENNIEIMDNKDETTWKLRI
ncbi:cysteine--tRNA ligase [Terrisporobacter mayombei]|uniref:Cysteine--tRNA ligase n=1 Tax=Terrisporobacter mayombei TaxID=1541 RepID=A0ABY9PZQ9_9FIRM|nr:cysteine--tRNA ligase [Terrisporobacter mayombei]MCC3868342.1 cysteine--tRNA ligase [Terrisporobacter mayombei]WMT80484.1 Cysteine--tRNA ligase [Terrisporobacter mayombei]